MRRHRRERVFGPGRARRGGANERAGARVLTPPLAGRACDIASALTADGSASVAVLYLRQCSWVRRGQGTASFLTRAEIVPRPFGPVPRDGSSSARAEIVS